jgi:ABC-2 type transport system permease protein
MVGIEMARAEGPVDIAQVAKEAAAKAIATEPNVKDESHTMNVVSIEFFTLIAMACMQGAMVSVELMNRSLPNITNRGKRVAVAPTKKSVIVFSNLLAGYIMVLATVILLILFTRFILGVEYGGSLALIGLLSAVGSLAATMFGMFLSVALKTRESAKNIIVVIVTMVGSLFAGMFGGMKIFFDELLPFVNKISPVGLITDGFYSLLYYDDMGRYVINILSLLAVAAVFFVLSVRSLRRQRYDSI